MVRNKATVAALREESTAGGKAAPAGDGGPLELSGQDEPANVKKIARALRAQKPELGDDSGDEAGADYLAASFVAYAIDAKPARVAEWRAVLAEVLADAATVLDDDDNDEAVGAVIGDLTRRGVLRAPERRIEEGSMVLAVLEEDDDWHEAFVQEGLGPDKWRVLFLEYGKPQDTLSIHIRLLEDVCEDEGGEWEEGKCEMCNRLLRLTFHHLIPKETHSTWLKKGLPKGVVGEPTRVFLNSYGTMVCGQCHSHVHHLASNDVLAREFNTLEKLMENPKIQRWVNYIASKTPSSMKMSHTSA